MILIIGRFRIKPELMDDFVSFAQAITLPQRQVEGCVSFDILQDVLRDDGFVMLETWEDREALEAHFETDAYVQADGILHQMVADEPLWEEYEV